MLDVFFQLKQTSFTEDQIVQLEKDLVSMNAHLTILWELKQAVLRAPGNKKRMKMRKNHAVMHLPDTIRMFGSLSKANADRCPVLVDFFIFPS
jgi:hypothetical protein